MIPREPVVLLPGMNCSQRLWDPVLESPALADLRAVERLDVVQPALGGSSLDDCVDRLLARLPPTFSLAGLSLGAIVALALVRRAPERVRRLALLSVNPRAPRPDQRAAWTAQRRSLAAGGTARSIQEELLPALVSSGHRSAGLDHLVLTMADEVGETLLDAQLAIQETRQDERPGLARVRVPTLVLAGAEDALVPVERHEEVQAGVPGAQLQVLDGVGHLSTLEAPDAVAAALSTWLAR